MICVQKFGHKTAAARFPNGPSRSIYAEKVPFWMLARALPDQPPRLNTEKARKVTRPKGACWIAGGGKTLGVRVNTLDSAGPDCDLQDLSRA